MRSASFLAITPIYAAAMWKVRGMGDTPGSSSSNVEGVPVRAGEYLLELMYKPVGL